MFRKILIANRGEIVNRIIRAAEKLGIVSVVIYSEADSGLDYLDSPVEKHLLKGSTLAATYLNADQIISLGKECRADAIHPGYGFLSENAGFASQCEKNQITWIGPSPEVMLKMSGKESSRQQAISAGVPALDTVMGTPAELIKLSDIFSYPILVKAVSGGGGRGMRIIHDLSQFNHQVEIASRESEHFFGDPRVFVEQYIEQAKHIEVQVIGDKHGNLVHFFERECTIQRRYQKIIEESPSPSLTDHQRESILNDAVKLAKSTGYDSAGTLEFLLDPHGKHYFMEMNTRIQVELPVTEMVTGIDLVVEQIRVAAGNPLAFKQEDIISTGHAIECRICAEDTASGFDPRPGQISLFQVPEAEGIRIDHAIGSRFVVSAMFDSLIAKVIVYDINRNAALQKMLSALKQLVVQGVETTIDYVCEVLNHTHFVSSRFYTDFIKQHTGDILSSIKKKKSEPPEAVYKTAYQILTTSNSSVNLSETGPTPWSTIGYWRLLTSIAIEYQGNIMRIEPPGIKEKPNGRIVCSIHQDRSAWISMDGHTYHITEPALTRTPGNRSDKGENGKKPAETSVLAPLPGMLTRLFVKAGDPVLKGDPVATIESMKTENHILAGSEGRIGTIFVSEGQQVRLNELILGIDNN